MIWHAAILAAAMVAQAGTEPLPEIRPAPQPAQVPHSEQHLSFAEKRAREEAMLDVLADAGFVGRTALVFPAGFFRFSAVGYPKDGPPPDLHMAWPWASITKQVLAVMVMQEVEAGRIDLDASASIYLPALTGTPAPTVRQLLQHRSGLRNPDDSPPDASGIPDFYTTGPTGIDWCVEGRAAPTEEWRYNNCDYIVLGALLEHTTGRDIDRLVAEQIGDPAGWTDTRLLGADEMREFAGQDMAYERRIARFGSSAALVGPLLDLMRFDRALLEGRLLGAAARSELWRSDPALGYMALGQWVFEAPVEGCDAPLQIVERRGGVGKYQVRNIILPERDIVLALVTDDGDFEFGEIWTGKGPMYEVLAAIACS